MPTPDPWATWQGQPQQYAPPPTPRQPHLAPDRPSRTMAGWALGLAIVPCCFGLTTVVGIVLGIRVLVKSRDGVDHGKGLAIAAVVIGPIWLVLIGIGALAGVFDGFVSDAQRDETGAVTERSQQSSLKLRNGDCFDDKVLAGLDVDGGSENSTTVTAVPCTQAHQFEVFHQFDLLDESYPGDSRVGQLAIDGCAKQFRAFVGVAYSRSRLEMYSLAPESKAWHSLDQRTVSCVVGQPGEVSTGSLRGSRW
jgi:hypothetical protein